VAQKECGLIKMEMCIKGKSQILYGLIITTPKKRGQLPLTITKTLRIMNNIRFIPGFYEWHLVDEKDNVLLNIPDGIIDDCETKADLDFVIRDIPRQALRAVEEGEELYGCDVIKYVSDIDDDSVTKLMIDTLSEYLGLTA
jgi:hypothetical protein